MGDGLFLGDDAVMPQQGLDPVYLFIEKGCEFPRIDLRDQVIAGRACGQVNGVVL